MALPLAPVVHRLRRMTGAAAEPVNDAELLGRFIRGGDEAAFAALVSRHGPLVLRVCRRVLADRQAAEDAFQVTFLVLARKAPRLARPEALAGWLHGVACRVARKASAARRRFTSLPADAQFGDVCAGAE